MTAKESRSNAGFVINLRVCQTPSDFCSCLRGLMWMCKNTIYSVLLTCLYTAKTKCKSQISLNSFFPCYNFYFLDYKTLWQISMFYYRQLLQMVSRSFEKCWSFPPVGLPCPPSIWWFLFYLIIFSFVMFGCCLLDACSFLMGDKMRESRGEGRREGRNYNCALMYEKRIYFKNREKGRTNKQKHQKENKECLFLKIMLKTRSCLLQMLCKFV